MSVVSQQSWANTNRPLFIPIAGISTLTATNIITSTLIAKDANISSIKALDVSTGILHAGFATADTLSTNKLNVSSIELVQFIDAQNQSTVNSVIEVGTISTLFTQHIILDQATLDVANGTTLLLNGIPIATTQDLSTIQDWSVYPAYSTIQFTTPNSIDIGTISSPARVVYASTLATNSAKFSTLNTQEAFTSSIYASTGSFSTINISSINGNPLFSASNWYLYPAKGNVTFQTDPVSQPQYNLTGVSNIVANNITAQLAGFPTPIAGGQITGAVVTGAVGNFGKVNGGDATFSNVLQNILVEAYGVNRAPGLPALYVNGGMTVDAGTVSHGITLGTNTVGVSLNRIDLLPVGTQDYVTWGAQAFVAGLGTTIDAGLGINIAAGLVVDVLGQDVQLRANDDISLDADDNIRMLTNTITEQATNYNITSSNYDLRASNATYTLSNFVVASSNVNQLSAQKITQGTVLPPSTVGSYSTTIINSIYEATPQSATLAVEDLRGFYNVISAPIWVVSSNISTTYTPSTTGILSSYTSTFTSSLQTVFSTIADIQSFKIGSIDITQSSMSIQHNALIEIDTKPFPALVQAPSLGSTLNISTLYSYQANADGFIKQEIGEVIQTITPVLNYFSVNYISTGLSGGNVISTNVSSIFSTVFLSSGFNSTPYTTSFLTPNCLSTEALCVSSINGLSPWPLPYGMFDSMSSFTLGANPELPIAFDNTVYALGTSYNITQPTEIKVDTPGLYRVMLSVVYSTTTNQLEIVNTYLKKNGIVVPRSNTKVATVKDGDTFLSVELFIDLVPTDYLEVWFNSLDVNTTATAFPAGALEPETPSIILTIQKIGV